MMHEFESPHVSVPSGLQVEDPVGLLRSYEVQPTEGLLVRVRQAIYRKTVMTQLTELSVLGPFELLKEMWLMLLEQHDLFGMRKGDINEE